MLLKRWLMMLGRAFFLSSERATYNDAPEVSLALNISSRAFE
jgi:hypothetical protein